MLNTRYIHFIHWCWQLILCICIMEPTVKTWEWRNLCLCSHPQSVQQHLEISFLQVTFCLGFGCTTAQIDHKRVLAHNFTSTHDVGAAPAWNRDKPALGLPAPGSDGESLTAAITGIKLHLSKLCVSAFHLKQVLWNCKASYISHFNSETLMTWNYASAWSCSVYLLNTARNSTVLAFPVFHSFNFLDSKLIPVIF